MSSTLGQGRTRAASKIFCLHALGSSGRAWAWVSAALGDTLDCVPIDLPGFGTATEVAGYDVAAMASYVSGRIREEATTHWLLAGHSMGAKVTLAVTRSVEDGSADISGLRGLVLLAASPPSPEPMSESKRRDSLAWIDEDAATRRDKAEAFVAENVGQALPAERHALAVDDILRAHPAAWKAWFARGSREDWSERIGVLDTPALVLSGSDDPALGPKAQIALTLPHLARVQAAKLSGARHLLPLERPAAVSDAIRGFQEQLYHSQI